MRNPCHLCVLTALLLCSSVLTHAAEESAALSFRQRASDRLSALTDPDEDDIRSEIGFGRQVTAQLLGKFPRAANDTLQRYVNLVGKHLAQHSARPELEFHFIVVETAQAATWSAPGGYVLITTATLAQLQDEAELAAVLAHEISHISERHILCNLRQSRQSDLLAEDILIRIVKHTGKAGDPTATQQTLKILLDTGHTTENELAADRLALQLLVLSGYDPLALPRYLARLGNTSKRIESLSTLITTQHLDALTLPRGIHRFATQTGNK